MLFLVKRRAGPALLSMIILAAAAWWVKSDLGLIWPVAQSPVNLAADALFALAVMLASDACLHGLFSGLMPGWYRPALSTLAGLFDAQTPWDFGLGALSAGSEELLFRGGVLTAGIAVLSLSPAASVALTALVFGAAHLIPRRRLWMFSLWAAWEGVLLGLFYLASGSLGAVVLAHVLHDGLGFMIFRRLLKPTPARTP